jgi:ABC-type multidrug transport system permease subunit
MIMGYASVSLIVGEKLKQNTNLKPQTQMLTLALGVLAVEFMSLFASFLRIFCGLFSPLCVIFAILGFMITYVVFTIGFGGAILTLLGTRPKDKIAPTTPTPEPVSPQT